MTSIRFESMSLSQLGLVLSKTIRKSQCMRCESGARPGIVEMGYIWIKCVQLSFFVAEVHIITVTHQVKICHYGFYSDTNWKANLRPFHSGGANLELVGLTLLCTKPHNPVSQPTQFQFNRHWSIFFFTNRTLSFSEIRSLPSDVNPLHPYYLPSKHMMARSTWLNKPSPESNTSNKSILKCSFLTSISQCISLNFYNGAIFT